jgi:hypothetical protein
MLLAMGTSWPSRNPQPAACRQKNGEVVLHHINETIVSIKYLKTFLECFIAHGQQWSEEKENET